MNENRNSGYRKIKQIILDRLRDKTWPPGSLLPTEVDLAREFGCARPTINRALRELADEGLLNRKRKAGTRVVEAPERKASFAIPSIRQEIEATGADYRYALVEREICTAPDWLRARIGLGISNRVLHLRCMHYADNSPYQFEDRWINLDTVPKAESEQFGDVNPNEWLVREVPFTTGRVAFTATKAGTGRAGFLDGSDSDPVFVAERTTWLGEAVVTFARSSFPAGYRMESGLQNGIRVLSRYYLQQSNESRSPR